MLKTIMEKNMKSKILMTVFLSLFCVEGLARSAVRPRPPRGIVPPNQGVSAFKSEIRLWPSSSCSGSCVQAVRPTLSEKGVQVVNRTPTAEREFFIPLLPPIFGALAAHHAPSTRVIAKTSLAEVSKKIERSKREAQEATTALATALQQSARDNWPLTAKENLTGFIQSLRDGVSLQEAEKLKEVKENCI